MGDDPVTGKDFNHRRQWVLRRLELLASCFAIDLGFFAILSNHLHLVIRTSPRGVKRMGACEVARRWLLAYPGQRILSDEVLEPSEKAVRRLAADKRRIKTIRKRLSDVSWYMSALKEPLARRANAEDRCDGHFWAKRFGCRAVHGENGLLVVGMYNDLNIVRAGEAPLPHVSPYCSAGLRFQAASQDRSVPWLAELTLQIDQNDKDPAEGGRRATDQGLLEMSREEYERLLTWAGTVPRRGKKAIPTELARLVASHGVQPEKLAELLTALPGVFRRSIGAARSLAEHARQTGKRWFQGLRQADDFFT